MKKTIFITGASSGLGKATALLFAQKGWNVIASMRNPGNEKELTNHPQVRLVALDVTQPGQIRQVTQDILKDTSIDIVFNNAGYGLAGPFEGATTEQIRKQIDTNVLGVMLVTQAFLPHFREKKQGLFINTTSIGGHVAFPFNSVYHATKWALEGWSESLLYELAPFNIKMKNIAPGGIHTDFAGRSLVMSDHKAYIHMMEKVTKVFFDPKMLKTFSTSEQIAEIVYTAATDGKDQLRYIAGKDARNMYRARKLFGYKFFMKQVRKTFFR